MSTLERTSSRRVVTSNLNLLTITPAFPIPISSDVLFKEGSAATAAHFTRSRTPSVLVAEELSPENPKLFSPENLLFDQLSLISNDSVSSASENEKGNRPIDQDKNCLQMSDWLIKNMEERQWRELTIGLDFREEVDPTLYLDSCSDTGIEGQQSDASRIDYQQEEGNSVFYANSSESHQQMPSTSRVYDVANDESDLSSIKLYKKSSLALKRRSTSETNIGPANCFPKNETLLYTGTDNIQELINILAKNSPQNSLRSDELLRTFNIPASAQIQLRNWRPPKKQFIFELFKPLDVITQLAIQKHRCAGCGLKLDRVYAKRALYCHYYSKLFCQCCHQGSKARIPARILHEWNFKEYPVCDSALNFLSKNEDQPVFNVRLINPGLYRKAKNMRKFRKLRVKISHMWPFVQVCNMTEELLTANGFLRTMFASVPKRFLALEYVDVYSLLDFERIANRNLIELVEPLAQMGAAHIEGCERCRQNAFLCQICMDPDDLLFPFQFERCYRCEGCGSLTHLKCYQKHFAENYEKAIRCEKCERIRRKKFRLQRSASSDRSAYESE